MKFLKASITKPVCFVSAGHFTSDEPWIHSKRCQNTFEIIIGVEGTAYIQQESEQYEVEPGCILLLLPNHTHKGYRYSDRPVSFYWLHFQLESPYFVLDEKDAEPEILIMNNNPYVKSLEETMLLPIFFKYKTDSRISILFNQMLHAAQSDYYTGMASDYLLTSLLIEITECFLSDYSIAGPEEKTARSFAKVLEWIRMHLTEDISVSDAAVRFNYNPDYLCRLFRKKMGMPLQEYIHRLKIEKAKELLYQSDKNIKEVAYELGFNDEKYFMKLFKRYERITPMSFRNAYYKTYFNCR